jgi:hypothetical protein
MLRLRINRDPFEYRVNLSRDELEKRLIEAMGPPGRPLVLPLVDPDGKDAGTKYIAGNSITEVRVDGVPPMDYPPHPYP